MKSKFAPQGIPGLLFLVVAVILPNPLLACSVCFVAKRENLMAFFATGMLLSLLPFVLVGSVAYWLYRQAKTRAVAMHEADGQGSGEDLL